MDEPNGHIIRECEPSDIGALRGLIHRTIDACYTGVYPPRAVRYFKDHHSDERIAQRLGEGEVLVLTRGDAVVATGALVDGEISGVFVDPASQHRGLGRDVMRALEERAAALGLPAIELSVSLPSRGFYESLGYGVFDTRSIDVGEGQSLDYWQARKALGRSGEVS